MARHRWTPPWDSLQDREVGGTTESRKPERGWAAGSRLVGTTSRSPGGRMRSRDLVT